MFALCRILAKTERHGEYLHRLTWQHVLRCWLCGSLLRQKYSFQVTAIKTLGKMCWNHGIVSTWKKRQGTDGARDHADMYCRCRGVFLYGGPWCESAIFWQVPVLFIRLCWASAAAHKKNDQFLRYGYCNEALKAKFLTIHYYQVLNKTIKRCNILSGSLSS